MLTIETAFLARLAGRRNCVGGPDEAAGTELNRSFADYSPFFSPAD